jgi:hypothetical protein
MMRSGVRGFGKRGFWFMGDDGVGCVDGKDSKRLGGRRGYI